MTDVSIAISAKDNFSGTLRTIRSAVTPFRKDLEMVQRELDTLNKTKVGMKVDLTEAERDLKTAKKAFQDLGDEITKTAYTAAQEKYDNLKSNLRAVSKQAQQTEKDITSLSGAYSKTSNKIGNSTQGGAASEGKSIFSKLGEAGATQFVGSIVSEIASTKMESALGQPMASAIGSALSAAASGAAFGTMIAPGIGTAVGAIAGGALGALQGSTEVSAAKDESFKSFVQTQTESRLNEQQNDLESGSSIAAQRETDQLAFATLAGGNAQTAKDFMSKLVAFSNKTPFEYDDMTADSRILKSYGYQFSEIIPTLTKIGDAGAALNMSADDIQQVSTAMGRMKSSGKTDLESLNILQDRGVDAVGALADSKGVSKGEIYKLISAGKLDGGDTVKTLLAYMQKMFGGAMEKQSSTYSGLQSSLDDAEKNQQAAMGAGYNETRKKGIQAQLDYYNSENGTKMQEANTAIGAWKAELENQKEQYIRDAMNAEMESAEYIQAKASGDRATMGELLAKAQTDGIMQYNASEGAQQEAQSQQALAKGIAADAVANDAYWDAGYQLGQQFSKGRDAAMNNQTDANNAAIYAINGISSGNSIADAYSSFYNTAGMGQKGTLDNDPQYSSSTSTSSKSKSSDLGLSVLHSVTSGLTGSGSVGPVARKSNAWGLQTVPYDNYPALLHQGERVLTASQARQADKSGSGGVIVHVHGMAVREEADVTKVAQEIVRQMQLAKAAAKPRG